ncbi:MAG: peptidase M10, partial [Ginsengibacter sp.]
MYPRGTIVDPAFQYDPNIPAGRTGGTMNPFTRKVKQKDIDYLRLGKLNFNEDGKAIVGNYSSVWHEAQVENK